MKKSVSDRIPYHVAIIMDGNGRWAKSRGLSRPFGHRKGAQRVKEVIGEATKIGIKILTLFAFSTENWNRSGKEIGNIFSYVYRFLNNEQGNILKNGIRLNVIGRKDRFQTRLRKKIALVQRLTRNNDRLILNLCLDYGGRWDIIQAVQTLVADCEKGVSDSKNINEDVFSRYLSLGEYPDPDLLIRTSGEMRISNFLLWDVAYSELYFTTLLWPDFDKRALHKAVEEYQNRERRYGAAQ